MTTAAKRAVAVARRLRHPRSWPVRWRLAAVSSGFTLVILLLFGGAIGQIATSRIRDDFNSEVSSAVQILASETRITYSLFHAPQVVPGLQLDAYVASDDASVRIYDASGKLRVESRNSVPMGRVTVGLSSHGSMRVAGAAITNESGRITGYIQYGRSINHVEATVDRVWLLIAAGIFGGTLLASFAAVAIAGRAMRPIASLTATARKIATTRDPSLQMPEPAVEDEVGELAQTLEEMLRSLDAARAEREETMQKQREFVADASHELRTPLTAVRGYADLYRAGGLQDPTELAVAMDRIGTESRRMGALVDDLLTLARLDQGLPVRREPLDLSAIARDAVADARALEPERPITGAIDPDVVVVGDEDRLRQVVGNLVANVRVHTARSTPFELVVRRVDERAELRVVDHGPGIPGEHGSSVFDRFHRVDLGRSRDRGGAGLGLSIAASIMAAHGGAIWHEPTPGGGATFVIQLPVTANSQVPPGAGSGNATRM